MTERAVENAALPPYGETIFDDYLHEVRQIPLLTAAEEMVLGRAIQEGTLARNQLNKLNGAIESSQRSQLMFKARRGEIARQRMTEANLRLVISIAKPYRGYGLPLVDLVQEGNIGLMRAVEKFDYRRGFKFSTYATWWIRQSVLRAIQDQSRTVTGLLPWLECLKSKSQ